MSARVVRSSWPLLVQGASVLRGKARSCLPRCLQALGRRTQLPVPSRVLIVTPLFSQSPHSASMTCLFGFPRSPSPVIHSYSHQKKFFKTPAPPTDVGQEHIHSSAVRGVWGGKPPSPILALSLTAGAWQAAGCRLLGVGLPRPCRGSAGCSRNMPDSEQGSRMAAPSWSCSTLPCPCLEMNRRADLAVAAPEEGP